MVKELQKIAEAVKRRQEDPEVVQAREAEKRVQSLLVDVTLLQEHLGGGLGDDLIAAAKKNQIGGEKLRAVRVALTYALGHVTVFECSLEESKSEALRRIGGEVTNLLSTFSMKELGLEARRG